MCQLGGGGHFIIIKRQERKKTVHLDEKGKKKETEHKRRRRTGRTNMRKCLRAGGHFSTGEYRYILRGEEKDGGIFFFFLKVKYIQCRCLFYLKGFGKKRKMAVEIFFL
jgi:hypothetical protein